MTGMVSTVYNPPYDMRSSLMCGAKEKVQSMHVCMYGHTHSKSMDQPGKVANPARGQLSRENEYFPVRVRA